MFKLCLGKEGMLIMRALVIRNLWGLKNGQLTLRLSSGTALRLSSEQEDFITGLNGHPPAP